jgi:uncharacterized membrane protein
MKSIRLKHKTRRSVPAVVPNKYATIALMSKFKLTLEKAIPYLLIVAGIIGLISSFAITYDKMKLLENPSYRPSCNLNPIISCGSVMQSKQGEAFGFPNPWLGLAAFAILLTIGMGMLAGAKFKRWFWLGLEAGTLFGIGFVHWLFFESVYRIHALCPWCMAVWVVVIASFWYVTLYNLQTGVIKLPKGKSWSKLGVFLRQHHLDIIILWYLIIVFLIFKHFWYYFGSHLF